MPTKFLRDPTILPGRGTADPLVMTDLSSLAAWRLGLPLGVPGFGPMKSRNLSVEKDRRKKINHLFKEYSYETA